MTSSFRSGFVDSLRVYFDVRVGIVAALGFSAGLPLALTTSTLSARLSDSDVSLSAIGLFSLVGLPYSLKFAWAPLIDSWRVPYLSRRLGRRRGWLTASQLTLASAIVCLGWIDPSSSATWIASAALATSAASATQDIVIDAYRIESLSEDRQAAGMASYVAAYRVALLVSGAGTLAAVHFLEGADVGSAWSWGYVLAAVPMSVGLAATLSARETEIEASSVEWSASSSAAGDALARAWSAGRDAFGEFLSRRGTAAILLFVLTFKFCDASAGVMTTPFLLDIGFDKLTIAGVSKAGGLAAILLGGFFGGFLLRGAGMLASLWISGIAQLASNGMFALQAWSGADVNLLAATIAIENFAGGAGTVIFVAYLSSLCRSRLHTATQFALLSAFASVGRTALSSGSGFVADAVGWVPFFLLTAAAGLPPLLLLDYMRRRRLLDRNETSASSVDSLAA